MCVLALLTCSCFTAVGLVVGGVTPDRETVAAERNAGYRADAPNLPEIGEEVEIELRSGRVVAGSYRGVWLGAFAVRTEEGLRAAPIADVREMRIIRGSYALEGLVIGVAADVVLFTVASGAPRN